MADQNDKRNAGLILYDSHFLNFEDNVQDFFIEHEVGHIKHGDLNGLEREDAYKLLLKRCCGIIPKLELKADVYAASVVGRNVAKKALLQMAKCKFLPLITKRELFLRWIYISLMPSKKLNKHA